MNFIQKLTRGADRSGALTINNHAGDTAFKAGVERHGAAFKHEAEAGPRRPLIGANLERMRCDAGKAVEVLEHTDTLLRAEILRLNGELENTRIALEAARAKLSILNASAAPSDAEVAAKLAEGLEDFNADDEPSFPFPTPFRDMSTQPPPRVDPAPIEAVPLQSLLRPATSAPVPLTDAERDALIPKAGGWRFKPESFA